MATTNLSQRAQKLKASLEHTQSNTIYLTCEESIARSQDLSRKRNERKELREQQAKLSNEKLALDTYGKLSAADYNKLKDQVKSDYQSANNSLRGAGKNTKSQYRSQMNAASKVLDLMRIFDSIEKAPQFNLKNLHNLVSDGAIFSVEGS